MSRPDTPQLEFDKKYISSREIVQRLKVSRPSISQARSRGILPAPIVVYGTLIFLWEREIVEPMIQAWEKMLNAKRAKKA